MIQVYMEMKYNMSIYIPSVTPSTTQEYIKHIFYNLWLGQVSRVDFVKREDSDNYMAFVHFDYWYQHANAYYLQKRIQDYGQSRIVYNDPHYWIVMKNDNPRSEAEIELERRVNALEQQLFDLTKKNEYMMRVIETHTRTFMDNGIKTRQVKHCSDCLTEIPIIDNDCAACSSMPNLEPPRPTTPPSRPRTPEEDHYDALALTGANGQNDQPYTYMPPPQDSVSESSEVKDPFFDVVSSTNDNQDETVESEPSKGWFWW